MNGNAHICYTSDSEGIALTVNLDGAEIIIGINPAMLTKFDQLIQGALPTIAGLLSTSIPGLTPAASTEFSMFDPDILEMLAQAGRMTDSESIIAAEGEQIAAKAESYANRKHPGRGGYSTVVRDDAIARYLAGEKISSIVASIGMTEQTLYRWLDDARVPRRRSRLLVGEIA